MYKVQGSRLSQLLFMYVNVMTMFVVYRHVGCSIIQGIVVWLVLVAWSLLILKRKT